MLSSLTEKLHSHPLPLKKKSQGKLETVSYLLGWLKHTGLSIFRVLLLVLFWESFPRLLAFAEAGETAEGKDASCSPQGSPQGYNWGR